MNTTAAHLVAIVCGFLIITSGLSAPSVNSEDNPNRAKRNLLNLLIGGLLPGTPEPPKTTATPAPEAATDSDALEEVSSGNNEVVVASFNASLVGDVQLPPIMLPAHRRSVKYNFIRIGSVINRNTAGNHGFVDLHDGIFTAPVAGKYRITMAVHVDVYKAAANDVTGIAICLNQICDGTLDRTALYSRMPVIGGNHVFKAAASLVLQENDSVKFLVFKTPQTGMQLLKETSVYGMQEPSY